MFLNKGGVNITKCIIYETSSASGGIQLVRVKFKMKKIMNESPPSSPPPPRWRRKRKLSVDDDIANFFTLDQCDQMAGWIAQIWPFATKKTCPIS